MYIGRDAWNNEVWELIPNELPSNMGMRRIFFNNETNEDPCEVCDSGKMKKVYNTDNYMCNVCGHHY